MGFAFHELGFVVETQGSGMETQYKERVDCDVTTWERGLIWVCGLCIPYRFKYNEDGMKICNEYEVLVISSQKGQGLMFPKGGWELDESLEQAASRESLEEAGVLGKVESQLGKWRFISKSQGTYYEGYMFPLFVEEQLDLWPEKHVRERIWMPVAEAREVCRHWWMKEALDILVKRLTIGEQNDNDLLATDDL
ncbi:nudix hydrolase 18 [Cucumis melo var. makuwa]|uniref:Nudix hydrolase 18 n=1 Tax=Cucumis melo var. makuwa TaxID=1194695 RepID=A0A5D3C5A2_CUCMM|nr:nudix hydrolase 18 [Cucumis melo var. makuwa]TYK05556.1 nudix hydrolase 18 [Cucumis melo var. makuwa]